jgi:hypothetical protein
MTNLCAARGTGSLSPVLARCADGLDIKEDVMFKKFMVASAVAAMFAVGVQTAQAAPVASCAIVAGPRNVAVTGSGLKPGGPTTFRVDGPNGVIGSGTNKTGTFSGTFALDGIGSYAITFSSAKTVKCAASAQLDSGEPTITLTLSDPTPTAGDVVHASATLTGMVGPEPDGRYVYTEYAPADPACSADSIDVGMGNVVNGIVPDSDQVHAGFQGPGEYGWTIEYAGDAYNLGTFSACVVMTVS